MCQGSTCSAINLTDNAVGSNPKAVLIISTYSPCY